MALTKEDYGNDVKQISDAYDKLQPEIDECDLACQYPEDDGTPLTIVFKRKDGTTYGQYNLPQQ